MSAQRVGAYIVICIVFVLVLRIDVGTDIGMSMPVVDKG